MSRSITSLGPPPPDVRVRPTFDTGDWSNLSNLFPLRNFPWNYVANTDGSAVDASQGEIAVSLPKTDGSYAPAKLRRQYDGRRQIIINNEDQYYVDEALLAEYGLPADYLLSVVNGVLEIRSKPTPAAMEDRCLSGSAVDFEIIGVDEAAGTITVKGRWWQCKEHSIDGTTYLRGGEYGGFATGYVDDLASGPRTFENKRKAHAYGIMQVKRSGVSDRYVHYDAVSSFDRNGNPITSDPELDRRFRIELGTDENGDPTSRNVYENFYTGTNDQFEDDPTTHVLSIVDGQIPAGEWPVVGDQIKPNKRMPWISMMLSTQTAFAQYGGVWEFDFQLDEHLRQFFAKFGWGDYTRVSSPTNGFEGISPTREATDESEIDDVENPTGGGKFRQFHNIHARATNGMLDFAKRSGRQPVLNVVGDHGVTGEWTKRGTQQHQMAIDETSPEFVSYTANFAKIRRYWWLEGNPYNKPPNSTEWYLEVPGLGWRRIGGALNPPAADRGQPFNAKCTFLNAAVWGDFCRSQVSYPINYSAYNDTDEIVNRVRSEKVWQFAGEVAGGGSVPNAAGDRPNGFLPVPGDITGGSGVGTVDDADCITLAGGGTGGAPSLSLNLTSLQTLPASNNVIGVTAETGSLITASSSDPAVAVISTMSASEVTFSGVQAGTAIVAVYATGTNGLITRRDVAVNVGNVANPSLGPPASTSESSVTQTGAVLSWDSAPNAEGYRVTVSNQSPVEVAGLTTSVTGLSPDTPYTYSVVAFASGYTDSSPATGAFRTEAEPDTGGGTGGAGGSTGGETGGGTGGNTGGGTGGGTGSGTGGGTGGGGTTGGGTGSGGGTVTPPDFSTGDAVIAESYRKIGRRDDGGLLLLGILAPDGGGDGPDFSTGGSTVASTFGFYSASAPAAGTLPGHLPSPSINGDGTTRLDEYNDFRVAYEIRTGIWVETGRKAVGASSAGVVPREIDAGGISRDAPAYLTLVSGQSLVAADVSAGQILIITNLAADANDSTSDHYIAAYIDGQPGWEEIT